MRDAEPQLSGERGPNEKRKDVLDQAYDGLEQELPDRVSRVLRWLRISESRWVRLPLGAVLILLSFFAWLPVIGIEFLPVGLLLIAQDVPVLREPVGKFMIWLECKWRSLRRWWKKRS